MDVEKKTAKIVNTVDDADICWCNFQLINNRHYAGQQIFLER